MRRVLFSFFSIFVLCFCHNSKNDKPTNLTASTKDNLSLKDRLTPHHLKVELLKNPFLHPQIKKHIQDSNTLVLLEYLADNLDTFKKVIVIGDINGDHKIDSVLLMPEMMYSHETGYEEGIAFVFSDPAIPRIKTNTLCVNLGSLFFVGDIDEDEWVELGQYYSSCASHYKTLILLRCNKENKWNAVEYCTYDTYFPEPHFSSRIRKIKKNQYEMTEITDDNLDDFGKLKKIIRYTIAD